MVNKSAHLDGNIFVQQEKQINIIGQDTVSGNFTYK